MLEGEGDAQRDVLPSLREFVHALYTHHFLQARVVSAGGIENLFGTGRNSSENVKPSMELRCICWSCNEPIFDWLDLDEEPRQNCSHAH